MGDLLFRNMDAPGSDKIADRLQAMLTQEIKQLEESKDIDPQMQQQMQQIEQQAQMIEEKGQQIMAFEQEVNAAAQEAGADKAAVDAAKKELEAAKKLFMAEIKLEEANMQLYAKNLKDEIDDALGEDDKDNKCKVHIKELEINAANSRHNREMGLKEHDSRMSDEPREDAIKEALTALGSQVQYLSERTEKQKPLNIERDDNDNIISVNGRKAKLSESGSFMGLEDMEAVTE
jgi:hypothetical protein